MRLSLAVCTYQRAKAVERLLESLVHIDNGCEEIIIVDSSPDDATEATVRSFKNLPIRYVRVGDEERGLTKQRNVAARMAMGDVIVYLDDDVVPDPFFFHELRMCWERHREAVGIGGVVRDPSWRLASETTRGPGWFVLDGWAREESFRWRLRRALGLASRLPPGYMPPEGHGRSADYPPSGSDYAVEFFMGGVASWRASVVRALKFSTFFEDYGLYEDLEFCIRAGKHGPLYVCSKAVVEHWHAPSGRPRNFDYGVMVVRNGWYVWRKRWPKPSIGARVKWWLILIILSVLRALNGFAGMVEACGRLYGMIWVLASPPEVTRDDGCGVPG